MTDVVQRGYIGGVGGTCGLAVYYGFNDRFAQLPVSRSDSIPSDSLGKVKGTGFFVAGFIDTPECRSTYKNLTDKNKVVYQSPIRRNTNSSRNFFFCIFDSKNEV